MTKERVNQILQDAPNNLNGSNFRIGKQHVDYINDDGFQINGDIDALLFVNSDNKEKFIGLNHIWF